MKNFHLQKYKNHLNISKNNLFFISYLEIMKNK